MLNGRSGRTLKSSAHAFRSPLRTLDIGVSTGTAPRCCMVGATDSRFDLRSCLPSKGRGLCVAAYMPQVDVVRQVARIPWPATVVRRVSEHAHPYGASSAQ